MYTTSVYTDSVYTDRVYTATQETGRPTGDRAYSSPRHIDNSEREHMLKFQYLSDITYIQTP